MKKLYSASLAILFLLLSCKSENPAALLPMVAPVKEVSAARVKADPENFFPVDPDYIWQYDILFHPEGDPYVDYKGTYTVRVDKVQKRSGETVLTLRGIDTLYNRYHFPEFIMSKNRLGLRGVNFFGFGSHEAESLNIDFLHLPLKTGDKWDDGLWTGKVLGREMVSVPAGKFYAWKIDVIGTHQNAYTAVGRYWVVPGVGIVKSELSIPGWTVESDLILAGSQGKK